MKKIILSALAFCLSFSLFGQQENVLPGFTKGPYYDEQILDFTYEPEALIYINAPSAAELDRNKPTKIVMYGLPNGNTITYTRGKVMHEGDDFRYDIQHIDAQTRFIRNTAKEYNFVTVYMQAAMRSWSTWRKGEPGKAQRDRMVVDMLEYVLEIFKDYNPHIELNSHSGGGNFIWAVMEACDEIPDYVKKISFIDSDYNWENEKYGPKLLAWLEKSEDNSLFVTGYGDYRARLDGKQFVSKQGGTWTRTKRMRKYLVENLKDTKWTRRHGCNVVYYTARDRKIQIYAIRNWERKIYHTVFVELNGYIQSVFIGTEHEGQGYTFMGERAYGEYVME